ncbi:MAG: M48 family metallopeptidase [Proteobacteria bacterium]|nr:M48 family metallopeptidase [Pseudomonadota bacterium]
MITTDETICIRGESIAYRLVRSKKRRRSLALRVNKKGTVQVNVPYNTSIKAIEDFLVSKFTWIQSKLLTDFSGTKPLTYIEGSKHYFLGVQYPLVLILASHSQVELSSNSIIIYHRKNVSIKNILSRWYKQQAEELFTKRTKLFMNQFKFPEVKAVKLRNMRARWGSCNNKAEITYNIHLIKAQPECIDYVVIHELCHLLHPNHGRGFYCLQSQLNPFYKRHKSLLNDNGYKYCNT